jgi:hypothetical protein
MHFSISPVPKFWTRLALSCYRFAFHLPFTVPGFRIGGIELQMWFSFTFLWHFRIGLAVLCYYRYCAFITLFLCPISGWPDSIVLRICICSLFCAIFWDQLQMCFSFTFPWHFRIGLDSSVLLLCVLLPFFWAYIRIDPTVLCSGSASVHRFVPYFGISLTVLHYGCAFCLSLFPCTLPFSSLAWQYFILFTIFQDQPCSIVERICISFTFFLCHISGSAWQYCATNVCFAPLFLWNSGLSSAILCYKCAFPVLGLISGCAWYVCAPNICLHTCPYAIFQLLHSSSMPWVCISLFVSFQI